MNSGWQYSVMAVLLVCRAALQVASPVAINRILKYLETGDEGLTVRPWVWVSALLVGPVASSIIWEAFMFISSQVVVWNECILTQLVFERALKMRLTDEGEAEAQPSGGDGVTPARDQNTCETESSSYHLLVRASTRLASFRSQL